MKIPCSSVKMGIVNFSCPPVELQPQSIKPHLNAYFSSDGMVRPKGKQSWFLCEAVCLRLLHTLCMTHPLSGFLSVMGVDDDNDAENDLSSQTQLKNKDSLTCRS